MASFSLHILISGKVEWDNYFFTADLLIQVFRYFLFQPYIVFQPNEHCLNHRFWLVSIAAEMLNFVSHKGHETESRVSRVTGLVSTTFLLPICLVAMTIWSVHRLIMGEADTVIYFWVTADILIKVHRNGPCVVLYQLYEFWLVIMALVRLIVFLF